MQQAQRAKQNLTKNKERIFPANMVDPIFICFLNNELENFESIFCQPILPTVIKAKLYELLIQVLRMDQKSISRSILKSKFLNFVIIDFDKY